MEREMRVPRVLFPVLMMIALALVVKGVEAQDRMAPERPLSTAYSVLSGTSGSYLGVVIREVTGEDVSRLNLSEERGALVTDVPEDGPAAAAGLQADDVIVSWNGSRIESASQLSRVVRETPSGRKVDLRYVRERRERSATVELADRSSAFSRVLPDDNVRLRLEERLAPLARMHVSPGRTNSFSSIFLSGGRLGVGVQSLGDQLAGYFGASDGGVLVASVNEDSPAAAAGLRAGDVIVSVGGDRVEDPGDLMEEIWEADEGEIEIRILRDREPRTLRATLPERDERIRSSGNSFYFGPQGSVSAPGVIWNDRFVAPEGTDFELRFPTPASPPAPVIST